MSTEEKTKEVTLDNLRTRFGRVVSASCIDGLYEKDPNCGGGNQTAATLLAELSDDDILSIDVEGGFRGHGYSHFVTVETMGGNFSFFADEVVRASVGDSIHLTDANKMGLVVLVVPEKRTYGVRFPGETGIINVSFDVPHTVMAD